jgi:hypothetical protein
MQVDEKDEKVRPLCYQRTTLILRDMPESTVRRSLSPFGPVFYTSVFVGFLG